VIHGIKDDNKPYKSIFVNPSRFVVNNNRLSHLVDVVAQWQEIIRKSQGFLSFMAYYPMAWLIQARFITFHNNLNDCQTGPCLGR